MTTPIIAHRKGYYQDLKAGSRLLWCSCGRSATQPFCDGAHQGTGFKPVKLRPERDQEVILCGCKHTKTPPFCDGTHSNLPGGYHQDDPLSAENRAVVAVAPTVSPEVQLDDRCYVFSTARAKRVLHGNIAYCPVISPAKGALFQSQFYAEISPGLSPVIAADGRETVLFTLSGVGTLDISGQKFELAARNGFYVRPDEAYRIDAAGPEPVKLYISQGPGALDLRWLDHMPDNFDQGQPERRAEIDPSQRHAMAERFFQMLVHRPQGSKVVTQFIGNIPLSKAEPHRHLYEEALIFLNGAGVVVGVIYPGDNPAVNY